MNCCRIVLYIDHFPDVAGGQMALLTRLDHLDRTAWRPLVVVPEIQGRLHEELDARDIDMVEMTLNRGDIRTHNEKDLLRRPLNVARQIPVVARAKVELKRLIRRESVDLVHTNSFKGALLVTLPTMITGTPIVYHAHSSRAYSDHGILDHVVCDTADRIVANSSFTAGTFSRWSNKTDVVYNPVDVDRFDPDNVSPESVRETYDAKGTPLIGMVGRLTPRKRQIDVLRAMSEILDAYPNATLLLVGGRYDGLGSKYEERVTGLIDTLDLRQNVVVTGYLDDIESTIAALDVLVHAAEKEPLGRVIIESLLLETPVVGTSDGGIPEILDHEETGLLVPTKDPPAIAEAVKRCLAEPEWAAKMGRHGRKKAREQFNAETITTAEERIYNEVIQS